MVYRGYRLPRNVHVEKGNKILGFCLLPIKPSQELHYHSEGFEFGYAGSGPSQLALALLYDVTGNRELALKHYQDFKWEYVNSWGNEWEITSEEILNWIRGQDKEMVYA